MSDSTFHILGIPGSLRRGSVNRGLLRAAQQVAPAGVEIEIYDLNDIPLFNEDVESEGNPPSVRDFKEHIHKADALMIAVPEYNYGIAGVLKNAIDWAARPAIATVLRHKPIALIGGGGAYGTVRAQLALRQVFVFTDSYVMPKPELMVIQAREKFDSEGNLHDEQIKERVKLVVEALVGWARRLKE